MTARIEADGAGMGGEEQFLFEVRVKRRSTARPVLPPAFLAVVGLMARLSLL